MGSDLFRVRVDSRVDSTELDGASFADNELDLGYLAGDAFGADVGPISVEKFRELAKDFAEGRAFAEVADALADTMAFDPSMVQALADAPLSLSAEEIDLANWHWLGHSVLAELFPGQIAPLTTSKVTFELAQIHPDARVPDDPFSLPPFALRLLAEASGTMSDNPIWAWFDRIEDNALLTLPGASEDALFSIVFGCGVDERFELETGANFGNGHEGAWWTQDQWVRQLMSETEVDPDGRFEVVRLWVRVLPAWIGNLVDDVFDSRAY